MTAIEEQHVPFFFAGFEALLLDPGFHLFASSSSEGVANDNGYSNPEFDALVAEGNATLDRDARCEIFAEAQARGIPFAPVYSTAENVTLSVCPAA